MVGLVAVLLFATLWTVGCQSLLSMGFPSQEYWSGLLFPSPGDLRYPRIKPLSLTSPELTGDSLPLNHREAPEKGICNC